MIWLIVTVILVLIAVALIAQGARQLALEAPMGNWIVALVWVLGGVIILALALGGLPPIKLTQ